MNGPISENIKAKKIRQEIEQFSQHLELLKKTPFWGAFRKKFGIQIKEFERIKVKMELFELRALSHRRLYHYKLL